MRQLLGLGFSATVLLACGGRSFLSTNSSPDGSGGSGGSTSSTTTTSASSSGTTTSTISSGTITGTGSSSTTTDTGSGGAAPCVGWAPALADPILISDPDVDTLLDSVATDGDRVLISTFADPNSPYVTPSWQVTAVAGDLSSVGAAQVAFAISPPSTSYRPLSLAVRDGQWAGIAYNEPAIYGCRFVKFADDGSKASFPVQIDTRRCVGLEASPSGYTALVFQKYSLNMVALDPSGAVVSNDPIVTYDKKPGVPAPQSGVGDLERARLDDRTTVIAEHTYHVDQAPQMTVALHHIDANGKPLGAPVSIGTLDPGDRFYMASMGTSILTAWTTDGSPGEVRLRRVDADGNVLGPDNVVAPADGEPVGMVGLVHVEGGTLVAWASILGDALHVQATTETGAPTGAPFSIAAPPGTGFSFAMTERLAMVKAAGGVLVVFEVRDLVTIDNQVLLTRLGCVK
jgi:hypothetical protein